MSLGKCKLKQQWDTTAYLLEQLKYGALTAPNAGEDVQQQDLSFIAGGNEKWYQHFGKQLVRFYTNLNILLPYDPAIVLLVTYPKELKTCPHKTCMLLSIKVLFITAETWKQPRCPSVVEWVNKWYRLVSFTPLVGDVDNTESYVCVGT